MFNKDGFEKLAEGVYVYKNFLTEKEIETLHQKAESLKEEDWAHSNSIDWYSTRTSGKIEELNNIFDRVQEIFMPSHSLTSAMSFQRMFEGDSMHEHTDTPPEGQDVTSNNDLNVGQKVKYGVVIYFNNFEGGEIYYPDLGIQHKPEPGDLLIHKAVIKHGVKKVTSGIRYVYPNFAFSL